MADTDAPGPLRLEVVPEELAGTPGEDLRAALTNHHVVRFQYPSADLWFVGLDVLDKDPVADPEQGSRFRAILHDMSGSEVVEAFGWLDDPGMVEVIPTARVRPTNDDEHAWALGQLRLDPDIAARLDSGELTAYRPMPPLAGRPQADGSIERIITVGLRDETGDPKHRIVALRAADGEVIEDAPGIPEPTSEDCGLPLGGGDLDVPAPNLPAGTVTLQARVRVWRDDDLLWDLVVVRPSASSGANGSGVELREVNHQRERVLHRAHLPIVNTAYDGGAAAHRDWLNEESAFEAEGEDPVPGFRVCTSAPRTILETNQGGGSFRGVALWMDGDELVIVSQLQAGWFRFVSEWRLHADGTIRPRLGSAAVSNPVTCRPHTHHAYWRLDFDIVTSGANQVQELNDPPLPGQLNPWQTVHYEVRRHRSSEHGRRWRVRAKRSSHGYTVIPGPGDGTADEFGAGDMWVLAYDGAEVDDGQGFTTEPLRARTQLDGFLSGELVERADLVLWYAVHIQDADQGAATGATGRAGPDLEPFNWRPPLERIYIPIEPPPLDDEPRD